MVPFAFDALMIPQQLDDVVEADLLALIDGQVREGVAIEYKQGMPAATAEEKDKLLAVVSSFANTHRGDLLIGVREARGLPLELTGITLDDPDQELLRLQQIIQSGLEPRLAVLHLKAVPLANSNYVVIIRVYESWNRPHRLVRQRHFYGRTSAGKQPLDIDEVRRAFLLSEGQAERVRDFVAERLLSIRASQLPVELVGKARLVLHLIPAQSVGTGSDVLATEVLEAQCPNRLTPIVSPGGSGHRLTLEGISVYAPGGVGEQSSLVSLSRSGVVEAVDAYHLDQGMIPTVEMEQRLLSALSRYFEVLRDVEIPPPVYLFLTLLDVRGFRVVAGPRAGTYPIDRDDILLPEVAVSELSTDPASILSPLFDRLWNAAGVRGGLFRN